MTEKKSALENEAEGSDLVFEFEGVEYTLPHAKRWPLKVQRAQEQGRMLGAVEALLGPKQWRTFDPTESRTTGDLDAFCEAMFDAMETDPKA